MSFPKLLATHVGAYLIKNWAFRRERFPFVLMIEPTERCNLTCAGCGRIREYHDCLDLNLSVETCLAAVDEVGAPTVTITGGEPLLHPDIKDIVDGIVKRKKHIHFCTNGQLLEANLDKFKAGPYLSWVLHMDGLEEAHDRNAGVPGTYRKALGAIRTAKAAGFRVYTNTTVFTDTDFNEVEELFRILTEAGVDGFMISPAFDFEIVGGTRFLSREEISQRFAPLDALRRKFSFYNTSAYLDFLAGRKTVECLPWSTPTLTPRGWRRPCYLLADEHCETYRELMEETDWEDYGVGKDKRCANCMVHSGFEAGLINRARRNLPELFSLARR
jgi:hopanoid biosynthesis associated radical SAM protein HpnH